MKQYLWILSIHILIRCAVSITRPPVMTTYPEMDVFFKAGETVKLPCEAVGSPHPGFKWVKDGKDFDPSGNDDRIVQIPNEGTLVINRPEDKDEGMYQCFAKNNFGRAMSVILNLREARLIDFPPTKSITLRPELGDSLTLNCVEPLSLPQAEIYWTLKDPGGGFSAIDYDKRVTLDHEARLRITNVLAEDYQNGKAYACMAMNAIVRRNTQGGEQYIRPRPGIANKYPPTTLWVSPSDISIIRGKTIRIKCIFAGNPTPDVFWKKASGSLQDKHSMDSFGQELVIPNAQYDDADTYECWSTNELSKVRVTQTITISVISMPVWVNKPKSVETSIGGKATFLCSAESRPEPEKHVWFINGKKISDMPKDPRWIIKRNNFTLVNLLVTDAMTIQCNISNSHGYVFTNVYLNVLEESPEFTKPPESFLRTAEGMSVNLSCQTTGQPKPLITWRKEGHQITGGRYQTLFNGDLHISSTVLADAGKFTCEAKNKFGSITSSGMLIIRRKTQIESYPLDLETNAGKDAKFTCSGTTDPAEVHNLKILWQKDGKLISTNDQRMTQNFQDSSLTISGAISRDSGIYTCIATNGLDNATASAMLTVRARPAKPKGVEVECKGKTAQVKWIPGSDNNAPIQFFTVNFNTTNNQDQWVYAMKVPSHSSTADVSLSPGVTYSFRIAATNKIGESEPSEHSKELCQTNEEKPSKHPQNVRTRGDKVGYLIIEWTEMPYIEHNGKGFQYVLLTKELGDSSVPQTSVPIDNYRTNHYEMKVNNIYQPYEITVKARNSYGDASVSAVPIIGYSGESTPKVRPENLAVTVISETEAVFTFSPVNTDVRYIQGHFRGYKLQYWKQSKKMETLQDHTLYVSSHQNNTRIKRSTEPVSFSIRNLLPFSNLEAQALVMNTYYVGPPSKIVSFQTQEGLPGPVNYLKAVVRGPNHFHLEWGNPIDPNGKIIGYDIAYQTVNDLNLGKMQDRESQIIKTIHEITLSGLKSSQLYRVLIWARTIKGRGDVYFIEVSTTRPAKPSAPSFTFDQIEFTYVNITWQQDFSRGAHSGSVYYIEYRKEGASDWQQTNEEIVLSWKNVTNLEEGTDYEFRVVATNGKFFSASGIQVATTKGNFVGYAGTSAWLYGMLVALLIIIIGLTIVYFLRKKRLQKGETTKESRQEIRRTAPEFQTQRGHYNDYVDGYKDNNGKSSIGTGSEKRPPSYSDVAYDDYEDDDDDFQDYYDNDNDYKDFHGKDTKESYPRYDNDFVPKGDEDSYRREGGSTNDVRDYYFSKDEFDDYSRNEPYDPPRNGRDYQPRNGRDYQPRNGRDYQPRNGRDYQPRNGRDYQLRSVRDQYDDHDDDDRYLKFDRDGYPINHGAPMTQSSMTTFV